MASSSDARPMARRGGSAGRSPQDAFHLPAIGASVAEARRRVLARLTEWDVAAMVRDNAQLVVSELFTNAVRHTDSDRVVCELGVTGARVRLEVTDQGHALSRPRPRARHADSDGENGRGLLLVSALAEEWGIRRGDSGRGHTVWAELGFGRPAS